MTSIGKGRVALLLATAVCATPTAWATNGYFPHGWGTKSGAMAGAGSALAEDALGAATNPAAIAALPRSEYVIGLAVIRAYPSYRASEYPPPSEPPPPGSFPLDPREEDADPDVSGNVFLVPQSAAAWRSGRAAYGVALYANGGLNSTFGDFENPSCPPGTAQRGVYCGGGASNDFAQLFLAPTYALQFGERLQIGASLLLAYQAIEIRGLSVFAPLSSRPDRLTNQGHEASYGYGLKLGVQAQLLEQLRGALVAQTRVQMSRLKAYEGLFADHGEFDVPPYFTAGLAWDVSPQWTAAADVQRIAYSQIRALGNDLGSPGALGDPDGPGFGWDDVTAYKLGLRYTAGPRWTLRAGYSYTEQPVDSSQLFFNILAGSVLSEHYTAGLSYRSAGGSEFDVSLMVAPEQTLRGDNPFYPAQQIDLSLGGVILDIAWRGAF